MILADIFVDLITKDSIDVGATLSTTIIANGVRGAISTSFMNPATPTGLTIGASQLAKRLDGIQIPGLFIPRSYPTRSFAFDHANILTTAEPVFTVSPSVISMGCFITFAPPNQGASSGLYDYITLIGFTGAYGAIQLNSGSGTPGGIYVVNIETNPGGTTTHSNAITITPGGTYWCTLKLDFTAGLAQLAVYETTGALVATASVAASTGDTVASCRIGNNEAGSATGYTSFIESVVFDQTIAAFPLGPGPRIKQLWQHGPLGLLVSIPFTPSSDPGIFQPNLAAY